MSKLNKILVVGAGIAGPSVCYWLQKYGFTPVMIENSASLRTGGQALDIRGVAVGLVKKIGIYDQICSKRTRLECARFVDLEGNILHEEHGEASGFRQGEEVEIIRGDLVQILMDMIPDVPCRFGTSIASIQQNDDGVTVQFKDGSVEEYDLVIGADGIHSATRRAAFNKEEYQLVNLGSYISIYTIPNYLHLSHTELLCETDQKLVTITSDADPDTAQAGFSFRSDHVLNNTRDKDEQMQFLRDTFHDFGWEASRMLELMPDSPDFYFDVITQVKMNSWSKGRVALLGDAGYCASPYSGQGNNLAIVGAYILAGELHAADGDYQQAFARYDELMRPFVEVTQEFGAWSSSTFLVKDAISADMAEERTKDVLQKIHYVANAIDLPEYE